MQRPSDDSQNIPPLTPQGPGAYYVPGGFAAVPGQTLLPTAVTRAWPTLPELMNAMKRRMVLATFLALLVGAAAAAAVWLAMPAGKHQVKALIQMKPYAPLLGAKNSGPDGDFESFKQNQVKLMKTTALFNRVITDPQIARLPLIQGSDDPKRMLDEQIRIKSESSELYEVTMQGDDPPQMKLIVDTLIARYLEDAASEDNVQRNRQIAKLEETKVKTDKRIETLEVKLKSVLTGGGSLTAEGNGFLTAALNADLTRVRALLTQAKSVVTQTEVKLKNDEDKLKTLNTEKVSEAAVLEYFKTNPTVRGKLADRDRLLGIIQQQLKFLPEDSSQIKAKRADVQQIESDLKAILDGLRPAAEKEIVAARTDKLQAEVTQQTDTLKVNRELVKKLEDERAGYEGQLRNVQQGALAVIDKKDLESLQEYRTKIQQEINQLEIAERNDIRVTSREKAEVLINQNLKQKVLLAAAAALVGGALIVLLVAFLEWRSRRVDSVDQVVNELGVRVIGTIPAFPSKASLKSGEAATNQNWRFVLNESVNSTRTMLLHAAKTQNMQVLMVTSAMQGEGKTSFASQLATSMATAGLRTLVLDTDLRNPSIHKLFDVPLTPGCSEVLCQEVDVSDAVQPTSIPNLWIIPAGQCSNRVIAALAQGHPIESLLNRLRGQFDFIVVDSCPILPVADALLVGQHVDGVVLSVLQDISQLPKVQTASEKLNQLNIPLLGAVVNGIKPDVHAYGYNYVKQLPA